MNWKCQGRVEINYVFILMLITEWNLKFFSISSTSSLNFPSQTYAIRDTFE